MKKDFKHLEETFRDSIKTWGYLVNWEKVFSNSSELEIALNKLNYLLGKKDLKTEFIKLYNDSVDIVKAFPILLAVREKKLEIYDLHTKESRFFNFLNQDENTADDYFVFIEKSGLSKLFQEDGVKNLVDYVFGVEVGLDSNGRKNRGGKLMEEIVEVYVSEFCKKRGLKYLVQANAKRIKNEWGFDIAVNKSSRSFDFAIYNPTNKKIKLIEANFYNGGGSKLKAVCGEFKGLYQELKRQGIDFIWITDGQGWKTARRPLEETYNNNEYVFNLYMLEEGVLDNLDW
ncbi:MAG: restriction endonuclease [Candidatus Magasanikbacteria bacterium CG_4_10_14_0_2_um_filter_41_10]|uniref:Type-2 restriction enzyme n=1 Tax=Candidatus Magasanikbacteria bacterium CG_4_10_14_0_2_um_filter_41_10 TaxID=1974638 RepID=A0A2M7V499_9BACT|nr:MAG: restriction endonuclease [Candidatus Magasanikbacteria bacterium CG_4_10_14_0_2_um_filter_41_10]